MLLISAVCSWLHSDWRRSGSSSLSSSSGRALSRDGKGLCEAQEGERTRLGRGSGKDKGIMGISNEQLFPVVSKQTK